LSFFSWVNFLKFSLSCVPQKTVKNFSFFVKFQKEKRRKKKN